MKAKRIPGEHCRWCGRTKIPLVKTKCCEQWICCDTKALSFRGGGSCQFEHERYSLCHFHFNEGHSGQWQECQQCRNDFKESYDDYAKDRNNFPRFLKAP